MHIHSQARWVAKKRPRVDKSWLRQGYSEVKPNMEEKNRVKITVQGCENPAPVVLGVGNRGIHIQRPQCLSSGNLGYCGIECSKREQESRTVH